ncbi:quinolinate synthase NadA [Tepidibacillus fermentans]|uniref:Quinolinate synthase n=1 Tax=Tepidibacillus fermentans TaxID=1281767 RepID=A0A4V2USY0_9BACI|nr:quinolinate synthase NadA [Tepidibacillus fermentans]TCS83171.1 quinolinate synthetase [Tepidibacillus fermentans]
MNVLEQTTEQMEQRILEIKQKFGDRLYIPGHHYQKNEVIQFADDVGDSLQLAQLAAKNKTAEFIIFCGVHFMAETADILTDEYQKVILPSLDAGCSMADMANIEQTERAWNQLQAHFEDTILPLTYVNSTAAIKAFVGRNGGSTLTSSNAKQVVRWAFTQKERILFLPDQHLGRNTGFELGIPLDQMAIWDPILERLEYDGDINQIKMILWKGHCNVHEKFTTKQVNHIRKTKPDMKIIVHPECPIEIVQLADENGSTNKIINTIAASPSGSKWAVGTEHNLVHRLAQTYTDKEIIPLNPYPCLCSTMNKIELKHLLDILEALETGEVRNQILVDQNTAKDAKIALERMLSL